MTIEDCLLAIQDFWLTIQDCLFAKSECKTPSDLWWKIEVFPLWKITLKLGSKVIYQRGKTSIFHQKSEGVLHSLFAGTSIRICRYYHQNLLQVIPSDLEGKNSIFFRRSFFPRYALGMPSFNNSEDLRKNG